MWLKIFNLNLIKILFIALGCLLIFLIFYFPNYAKLKSLREANLELEKEIENLQKEIKDLEKKHKSLNQSNFIYEKMAREKLGLAKPGEIVIDIEE